MGDFSDYKNVCFFSTKRKHNKQIDMEKVKDECVNLRKYIDVYNISLVSLSRDIATEGDRNMMLNVAKFVVDDEKILKQFRITKVLPKKRIALMTKTDFMKIQRYIDYLKLYIVLLMDDQFSTILTYLNIQLTEQKRRLIPVLNKDDKQELYKGLAIDISKYGKSIFIITRQGIVADVQYVKGAVIGNEVLAKKFKYIPTFIKISFGIAIVLAIIFFVLNSIYNISDTTVVIRTTSEINVEVNSMGKVIDVNSPTEKGKLMIEQEKFRGDRLDDTVISILEYADKNSMIPSDAVVNIAITSDDFDMKTLAKTSDYVESQYLDDDKKSDYFRLVINNDGSQTTIRPDKEKTKSKEK